MMIVILTSVREYLVVVLICISCLSVLSAMEKQNWDSLGPTDTNPCLACPQSLPSSQSSCRNLLRILQGLREGYWGLNWSGLPFYFWSSYIWAVRYVTTSCKWLFKCQLNVISIKRKLKFWTFLWWSGWEYTCQRRRHGLSSGPGGFPMPWSN